MLNIYGYCKNDYLTLEKYLLKYIVYILLVLYLEIKGE